MENIISPLSPSEKNDKPALIPKNTLGYEPNQMVCKWAIHTLGTSLFIIRRLESKPDQEAYQARYLDSNGVLIIDVFYPEEFKLLM